MILDQYILTYYIILLTNDLINEFKKEAKDIIRRLRNIHYRMNKEIKQKKKNV